MMTDDTNERVRSEDVARYLQHAAPVWRTLAITGDDALPRSLVFVAPTEDGVRAGLDPLTAVPFARFMAQCARHGWTMPRPPRPGHILVAVPHIVDAALALRCHSVRFVSEADLAAVLEPQAGETIVTVDNELARGDLAALDAAVIEWRSGESLTGARQVKREVMRAPTHDVLLRYSEGGQLAMVRRGSTPGTLLVRGASLPAGLALVPPSSTLS
jgi:hypothetical protein